MQLALGPYNLILADAVNPEILERDMQHNALRERCLCQEGRELQAVPTSAKLCLCLDLTSGVCSVGGKSKAGWGPAPLAGGETPRGEGEL